MTTLPGKAIENDLSKSSDCNLVVDNSMERNPVTLNSYAT